MKNIFFTMFFIIVLNFSTAVCAANEQLELKIIDTNNGNSIQNLNIPLKTNENVEILQSGNVTASTILTDFETELNNIGITAGNPPTISPLVCTNGVSCGSVTTSNTTVTSTITDDAVYCIEYLDGTEVNTSINRFVTSTSYTTQQGGLYKVSCGNNFGVTDEQIQINLTAPPQITFSASPTTVVSGGSSTLTWSISNAPDSCTFTGNWPNGNQTNVSPNFYNSPLIISNITSNQSFSMNCTNSAGTSTTAIANISLSGSTGSSWTTCGDGSTANPILSGAEDRTILANGTANAGPYNGTFEDIQGERDAQGVVIGPAFPGRSGENIHLSLNRNKYMAVKITAPSSIRSGTLRLGQNTAQEGPQPDRVTMTIANCPGEFETLLNNEPACRVPGLLAWSTDPNASSSFCHLQQNQTYYINIVDSDNSENNNYSTTDCNPSTSLDYCGVFLTPQDQ